MKIGDDDASTGWSSNFDGKYRILVRHVYLRTFLATPTDRYYRLIVTNTTQGDHCLGHIRELNQGVRFY